MITIPSWPLMLSLHWGIDDHVLMITTTFCMLSQTNALRYLCIVILTAIKCSINAIQWLPKFIVKEHHCPSPCLSTLCAITPHLLE